MDALVAIVVGNDDAEEIIAFAGHQVAVLDFAAERDGALEFGHRLAALVFDSYLELADAEREALLARYWQARGSAPDPAAFALLTVQRKCKDYGRFRYVTEVKHDVRYGPFIERARTVVLGALPRLPEAQRPLAELLREALARGRP